MLPPSFHRLHEAIATVRGVSPANIEAYSRVLRKAGILPETGRGSAATPPTTLHAAYMLAAILRGSPTAAADNAKEVGGLIINRVDGLTEPSIVPAYHALRESLGWPEDMTFAGAVAWLLDRLIDDSLATYIETGIYKGITLTADRYWTEATIAFHPTAKIVKRYIEGARESEFSAAYFDPDGRIHAGLVRADGTLNEPLKVGFHSPLLHEMKLSYKDGTDRNQKAHKAFMALKQSRSYDIHGTESSTLRTLIAVSEVFKPSRTGNASATSVGDDEHRIG
jgi:hypothetical protein